MWVPQGPGEYAGERTAREPAPRAQPVQRAPASTAAGAAGRSAEPAPSVPGAYTQATRYGDLLFVSGQIAMDLASGALKPGNIDEQTRQVMENIRTVLDAHRLTMANIVSVTVYMKDLNNDFRGMDAAYETFFRGSLPARSVVEVAKLPRGVLLEISVIAGR